MTLISSRDDGSEGVVPPGGELCERCVRVVMAQSGAAPSPFFHALDKRTVVAFRQRPRHQSLRRTPVTPISIVGTAIASSAFPSEGTCRSALRTVSTNAGSAIAKVPTRLEVDRRG